MRHVPVAKPSPIPSWTFPRRGFAIAIVLVGILAFAAVALVTATPQNVSHETFGPHWITTVRANDLAPNEPMHNTEGRFWLVKLNGGTILALSHKDPRLGCTVPWRPDFTFMGMKGWFRNPCHSQTYDLTGACYDGPCIRGLDRYETRIVDGKIQVHVGASTLIEGPPVNTSIKPYRP